jgi:hypothetical protein
MLARLILAASCWYLASIYAQPFYKDLKGYVVDEHGNGIESALIVASGAGFNGWATTETDGSFQLRGAGAFVSVRHPHFKARLVATSDLIPPIRIQLSGADDRPGTSHPARLCPMPAERGSAEGFASMLLVDATKGRNMANTIHTGILSSTRTHFTLWTDTPGTRGCRSRVFSQDRKSLESVPGSLVRSLVSICRVKRGRESAGDGWELQLLSPSIQQRQRGNSRLL